MDQKELNQHAARILRGVAEDVDNGKWTPYMVYGEEGSHLDSNIRLKTDFKGCAVQLLSHREFVLDSETDIPTQDVQHAGILALRTLESVVPDTDGLTGGLGRWNDTSTADVVAAKMREAAAWLEA